MIILEARKSLIVKSSTETLNALLTTVQFTVEINQ